MGGAWWLAERGASLGWVFACASAGAFLFGAINFVGLLTGRAAASAPAS